MSSVADESVRHHEKRAAESRERLASTLDELSVKLTPGGVVDELLTYAKAGSGDFFRALAKSAAANPLPTLLVGAGCVMFLTQRGRVDWSRRSEGGWRQREIRAHENGNPADYAEFGPTRRSTSRLGSLTQRAGEMIAGVPRAGASGVKGAAAAAGSVAAAAGSAVGDAVGTTRDTIGSTVGGATDQVRAAAAAAGSVVTDATDRISDTAASLGEAAGQYAGGVRQTVTEAGRRTAERANALAERAAALAREQPLLVAAGGLVVGAAIAALLPRTKLEDSMVGEASDAVKDAVGTIASEQYQAAKSAAGKVAGEVMEEAERDGLTGQAATEALRDIGDKMAKVAETGAEAVQQKVRDNLSKAAS